MDTENSKIGTLDVKLLVNVLKNRWKQEEMKREKEEGNTLGNFWMQNYNNLPPLIARATIFIKLIKK